MATAVIALSTILQITAAIFALRLIGVSRHRTGWVLIATAMALMCIRRIVSLVRMLHPSDELTRPPDMTAELVALIISVMMLAGVYFISRMFAESARLNEDMRASEEKYRELFHGSIDGIFRADENCKISLANKSFCSMADIDDSAQILGRKVTDLLRPVGLPHGTRPASLAELAGLVGDTRKIEVRFLRQDGTESPAEMGITFFRDADGNITGCEGVVRDLREQKRAEGEINKLFHAIEQSSEMVVITDVGGFITYINPAFEEVTGYRRHETLGKTPRILKSGRHSKEQYEAVWRTISTGNRWSGTFINRKKNGSLFEDHTDITPLFDAENNIEGYIALKRDVTRERMLDKAKQFFVSVTAHELRTPLTKLGFVRLIMQNISADGKIAPQSKSDAFDALNSSIGDFERIVSASDIFTEITTTRPGDRHFARISRKMILQYLVEYARGMIAENGRNIEIIADIDLQGGDTFINCNHGMCLRAIEEILSNAVKYTADGKRVFLESAVEDEKISITIRDEGIGIPADKLGLIKDPMFSLEDFRHHFTSKFKYMGGGIGMGLTLANMIAEYHGGSLEVKSGGEGLGASVKFTIPV